MPTDPIQHRLSPCLAAAIAQHKARHPLYCDHKLVTDPHDPRRVTCGKCGIVGRVIDGAVRWGPNG